MGLFVRNLLEPARKQNENMHIVFTDTCAEPPFGALFGRSAYLLALYKVIWEPTGSDSMVLIIRTLY